MAFLKFFSVILSFLWLFHNFRQNSVNSQECEHQGEYTDPAIIGLLGGSFTPDENASYSGTTRPQCQLEYLNKIASEIRRYNTAYRKKTVPEINTAAEIALGYFQPREKTNKSCHHDVVNYVKTVFKQGFPKNDSSFYQKVLRESLDKVQIEYCTGNCEEKDNECIKSCAEKHVNYRLISPYDNIFGDWITEMLRPNNDNVWNVYFLREFCIARFAVGSRIVSFSNNVDEALYRVFLRRVRGDAEMCLRAVGKTVENAIQSLDKDDRGRAALYRAMIWHDLQPWLDAIASLAGFDTPFRSGLSSTLTRGMKIMLRMPLGSHWLGCGDSCEWSDCPGNGPRYNDSSDIPFMSRCGGVVFQIEKLSPENGAGTQQITVHEQVKLLTTNGQRLVWDYINRIFITTCRPWLLKFSPVNDTTPSPKNSVFTIEAWDWSGRRRLPGELISDRDYILLMYADGMPDHKKLWFGRRMYYMEGFVFILGDLPNIA